LLREPSGAYDVFSVGVSQKRHQAHPAILEFSFANFLFLGKWKDLDHIVEQTGAAPYSKARVSKLDKPIFRPGERWRRHAPYPQQRKGPGASSSHAFRNYHVNVLNQKSVLIGK